MSRRIHRLPVRHGLVSAAKLVLAAMVTVAVAAATGCAGASAPSDDDAGGWEPTGQVTVVVPYAAGGGTDLFGRAIAAGIEQVRPGVEVTVENRTGGSGAVGYGYLASQAGDPHFLLPESTPMVMLPELQDLPLPWEEWTTIGQVGSTDSLFVVSADSPWQTMEQFVSAATEAGAAGTPLKMGLGAAVGVDPVNSHLLQREAGVELEHVIFDGGTPANAGLLAGDIDATFVGVGDGVPQIEAGEFRALAVLSTERLDHPAVESVPSMTEQGFDVTLGVFRGVIAPPGVLEEARAYWIEALREWVDTDAFAEYQTSNNLSGERYWGDDWDAQLRQFAEQVREVADEIGTG